ncbi:MAG: thioredoxin family protein, partial [Blastocatellia bacterium]|nr:thioredoxin family protein [Blastocatellia bacterium]
FDKNLDIASKYGVDLKKLGVPTIVILDKKGSVLKVQNTGELEEGQKHSPTKVLELLKNYSQ